MAELWTCPTCQAANPPEKIFCGPCGAIRVKAPPRESQALAEEGTRVWPSSQFRGTALGFCLWWIGATVGGQILGWTTSWGIMRWMAEGMFHVRIMILLFFALSGQAIGLAQAMTLRYFVRRGFWMGWVWASLAGAIVAGASYQLAFDDPASPGDRLFLYNLAWGAFGAAVTGILQSWVLLCRIGPASWVVGWTLICAGSDVLSTLATIPLQRFASQYGVPGSWGLIAVYAGNAVATIISAAGTGLPLGLWLRRRVLAASGRTPGESA